MEPKIMQQPAIKVAGYELRTTHQDGRNKREIPEFWKRFMMRTEESVWIPANMETNPGALLGICIPEGGMENGEFIYMIAGAVNSFEGLPAEIARREIPAATFAVFTTPPAERSEFTQAIQGTWQYIYKTWFPSSGYEFDISSYDYELYDERSDWNREPGCQADIYIPIKSRK